MGSRPTQFARTKAKGKGAATSDLQAEIRAQIEAGRTGEQRGVLSTEAETAERTGQFETKTPATREQEKVLEEFRDRNRAAAGEFNQATSAANILRKEETSREERFFEKRQREISQRLSRPGRGAALVGGRRRALIA